MCVSLIVITFKTSINVKRGGGDLKNPNLQKQVDLKLKKAVEIAQGMETAERNAKSLKPVVQMVTASGGDPKVPCFRCGRLPASQQVCPSNMPQLRQERTHHSCLLIPSIVREQAAGIFVGRGDRRFRAPTGWRQRWNQAAIC